MARPWARFDPRRSRSTSSSAPSLPSSPVTLPGSTPERPSRRTRFWRRTKREVGEEARSKENWFWGGLGCLELTVLATLGAVLAGRAGAPR